MSKHSHSALHSPEFRPEAAVRAGEGGGGETGAGVGQGQRVGLVAWDRARHRGEAGDGRVARHRAQAARVAGAGLLVAGVARGDRQLTGAISGTESVIRGHRGQGAGVARARSVAAQGGVSVGAGAADRGRGEHGGAPGGRQPRHGGAQRGLKGGGLGSVTRAKVQRRLGAGEVHGLSLQLGDGARGGLGKQPGARAGGGVGQDGAGPAGTRESNSIKTCIITRGETKHRGNKAWG